ncbi:hypothetical protein RJT34_16685 [Clitoria ternatea]|uniref:Uncharacterized protein n=1 Tax=Clitoria ternatea TaxID=43366 RepID=A0AAN9PCG3_CLITE
MISSTSQDSQPHQVEHPFEKDIEVIESLVRRYGDPLPPLGVEELEEIVGQEVALTANPLEPNPLPELPLASSQITYLEYISLSLGENSDDEPEEDPGEDPEDDLEEEPMDIMAANPDILPALLYCIHWTIQSLTALPTDLQPSTSVAPPEPAAQPPVTQASTSATPTKSPWMDDD